MPHPHLDPSLQPQIGDRVRYTAPSALEEDDVPGGAWEARRHQDSIVVDEYTVVDATTDPSAPRARRMLVLHQLRGALRPRSGEQEWGAAQEHVRVVAAAAYIPIAEEHDALLPLQPSAPAHHTDVKSPLAAQ